MAENGRLLFVLKDRIQRKAVKEILESRRPDIALHAARCKGGKAPFQVPLLWLNKFHCTSNWNDCCTVVLTGLPASTDGSIFH